MAEPQANPTEDENAAAQEEGEAAAAEPGPSSGGTAGIEVHLVSLAAARSVAAAIARRCRRALGKPERAPEGEAPSPIILLGGSAVAAAASVRMLNAELDALATVLGAIQPEADQTLEALEWPRLDSEFRDNLKSITDAVTELGVEESFERQATIIDESALFTILAGALLEANFEPEIVASDAARLPRPLPKAEHVLGEIARVRGLPGSEDPDRKALLDHAEAAIERLRVKSADVSLGMLLLDALAAQQTTPLLTARSFAAGGAYRTRKHVFTLLGLVRGLSFSGGSAIEFRLTDRKGKLLAADMLYHAGRERKIPRSDEKLLSNL
jgi:hypothetical protein